MPVGEWREICECGLMIFVYWPSSAPAARTIFAEEATYRQYLGYHPFDPVIAESVPSAGPDHEAAVITVGCPCVVVNAIRSRPQRLTNALDQFPVKLKLRAPNLRRKCLPLGITIIKINAPGCCKQAIENRIGGSYGSVQIICIASHSIKPCMHYCHRHVAAEERPHCLVSCIFYPDCFGQQVQMTL